MIYFALFPLVPMDLDVKVKATMLGAAFLIVSINLYLKLRSETYNYFLTIQITAVCSKLRFLLAKFATEKYLQGQNYRRFALINNN